MPGVGLCTLMCLPYMRSAHRVEEDDHGGHQELVMDGLPVAFGTFMVGATAPVCGCTSAHPSTPLIP